MINISANINGIRYTPFLCRKLHTFNISELSEALSKEATFILRVDDKNQIAMSWWVSAKRTRSYPYTRIYDFLSFSGKKLTVIPIVKDEGKEGDRDFLQWDTISLMSLLSVYVIISYYKYADKSLRYKNKITNQRFDVEQIKFEMKKLLSYQSDALHWNIEQINKVGELGKNALVSYEKISNSLVIEMHSKESAEKRIKELLKEKEAFMNLSRGLAQKAQQRESITVQPKEKLVGVKAALTIKNYLGGNYYFTSDEAEINNENISLIEAKHSKENKLPSIGDIKDGLLKMILFTNLENVKIDNKNYNPIPVLKLTTGVGFNIKNISGPNKEMLNLLKKEAEINKFRIIINNSFFI
jgi:hypothetical protein